MLPCSASAMAQHPGWAPALKVGSRLVGALSHHRAAPCRISKDWYLLPTPPACCFPSSPAAWHALARNPEHGTQPFQMARLWVLGTWASSTLTQEPLRSWDQCPADAHKRIGLELLQVPCGHPVPCLGKTSTDENGSMIKGREGKGAISMWKKGKYHTKLFHR